MRQSNVYSMLEPLNRAKPLHYTRSVLFLTQVVAIQQSSYAKIKPLYRYALRESTFYFCSFFFKNVVKNKVSRIKRNGITVYMFPIHTNDLQHK